MLGSPPYLIGSVLEKAIVHDLPGVTRDRKYADAKIGPMLFRIVDTRVLKNQKKVC